MKSKVRILINTIYLKCSHIKVETYTVRQRRGKNEDYYCNLCNRWGGENERDHFESWCKGIEGTPTSSSSTVYIASRCKRFRHLTRLVDY